MSRETFDPLIGQCVESSAQFVHQVISRAGRNPEAVVLLGAGAHIPLVQEVLRSWLGLPLVVPHEPELVLAKGGAMAAATPATSQPASTRARFVPGRPSSTSAEPEQIRVVTAAATSPCAVADSADDKKPWWTSLAGRGPSVSGKQISGAGLAGTALAVVAVIGVALSAGFTGASADETSPTQSYAPSTSSAPRPSPAPAVAPTQVTTTTTTTPEPAPTTYSPRPVPPAPEPPPAPPPTIPGLGVPVPTLPPLPTIELPPLPQIRLP